MMINIFYLFKPFRTSSIVKTGPKSIYGNDEMGRKFVDPNPGQQYDDVVRCLELTSTEELTINNCSPTELWDLLLDLRSSTRKEMLVRSLFSLTLEIMLISWY